MLVIADRIPASRLQAFTAAVYLNRSSEEAASACDIQQAPQLAGGPYCYPTMSAGLGSRMNIYRRETY